MQLNILSSITDSRFNELEKVSLNLQQELDSFQSTLGYKNASNCGPGLWQCVAYLNMSDPSHQCPPVWREYSANGVRACGRPANAPGPSCYSMNYSSATSYTRVCGQVIGYQIGSTDVFTPRFNDINNAYGDGVSITHGVPRKHIWTYVAGISDIIVSENKLYVCPCLAVGSPYQPQTPPSFVGNNYYCESGNPNTTFQDTNTLIYTDDPLWDGQNCEGQCCSDGRNPPWFSVQLTDRTTSNIEVRICGTETIASEDSPIKLLELYVQ